MVMSDPVMPMEVDHDDTASEISSASSSEGPTGSQGTNVRHEENVPTTNGSPIPPPHKVNPSPPASTKPVVDPEEFKAAGNKFFAAKDYKKAIREYTKGGQRRSCGIIL